MKCSVCMMIRQTSICHDSHHTAILTGKPVNKWDGHIVKILKYIQVKRETTQFDPLVNAVICYWILNLWGYTTTSHCLCCHHHHAYNAWEAKSCLANQQMSCLLRYPKVHTMSLRQTNLIPRFSDAVIRIKFNINLPSTPTVCKDFWQKFPNSYWMEKFSQVTLICCVCLLITAEIREIQLAADVTYESEEHVMGERYNIL